VVKIVDRINRYESVLFISGESDVEFVGELNRARAKPATDERQVLFTRLFRSICIVICF